MGLSQASIQTAAKDITVGVYFGGWLQAERKQRGKLENKVYSQESVASHLTAGRTRPISPAFISAIERGVKELPPDHIEALALYLKCPVIFLKRQLVIDSVVEAILRADTRCGSTTLYEDKVAATPPEDRDDVAEPPTGLDYQGAKIVLSIALYEYEKLLTKKEPAPLSKDYLGDLLSPQAPLQELLGAIVRWAHTCDPPPSPESLRRLAALINERPSRMSTAAAALQAGGGLSPSAQDLFGEMVKSIAGILGARRSSRRVAQADQEETP